MDDDDLVSWIYLDGPEPEPVREMLDLLRVLPAATAEDVARMERVYFARFSGAAGLGLGDPSDPLPFPLPLPDPDLGPREGEGEREAQSRPAVTMGEVPPSLPAQWMTMEEDPPSLPARWMTMGGDPPTPPVPPVTMGGDFPKPAVPPPSALASTSLELDLRLLEAGRTTPFVRPQDLLPTQRATRTRQSLAYPRPGMGETAPPDDESVARLTAGLPFIGEADFKLGGLTLEQYASFCAELLIAPAAEAQILERYYVEARAALDEQWQRHLARYPPRRDAFERNLAEFTRYLRDPDARARSGRT